MPLTLEGLDQRLIRIKGFTYEVVKERFGDIDRKFDMIDGRITSFRDEVNTRFSEFRGEMEKVRYELRSEFSEKIDGVRVDVEDGYCEDKFDQVDDRIVDRIFSVDNNGDMGYIKFCLEVKK
jgi:hypothetical protein